uniref:Uncharacterized protein n=1 Tax=Lotharella oceanica TaxID=641309 RepID=A0A7S2XA74_9EUKA|mmetsp:Transcript_22199/g.41612  ORF Transcript_22199/g.41612 Transcript_22199/m.41612 type:complete len:397 (+) Transcript_22199:74-1264(+)
MDVKTVPLIFVILTVVVGIISMSLSISAYSTWKREAGDYDSILGNWKMTPIVNFTIVASADSCPSGWETVNFGEVKYQQAFCVGDNVTTDFFCDAPPPVKSGNEVFNTIATYGLGLWQNNKVCILRSGSNAIDRPLGASSGFRSCGSNPETGEFYFNNDLPCPITSISSVQPTSGTFETYMTGNSRTLYVQINAELGRPFLQFTTGEGLPCSRDFSEFNGVRSSSNPPGLNQSLQAFTVQTMGGVDRNPFHTEHPTIGACATDNRFVEADTMFENELYDVNLVTNNGAIPRSSYVYASDSNSVNWTLWNRPEILWRSTCEYSREDVNNIDGIIKVVTATTLAVMIISIFAAIFDCILEAWAFKNAHDDDESNDDEAAYWQKFGNCNSKMSLSFFIS